MEEKNLSQMWEERIQEKMEKKAPMKQHKSKVRSQAQKAFGGKY